MDLNFSLITRPVERLVATAQNGLEVLRLGGLETDTAPSFAWQSMIPRVRTASRTAPKGRPRSGDAPRRQSAGYRFPQTPNVSTTVRAMKAGAIEFLTKPVDPAELEEMFAGLFPNKDGLPHTVAA